MFYGFLSGYFLTKIAFPDIDILHPAVLSIPPKTMCLYNYYIAYVREGTILKVGVISEQQETHFYDLCLPSSIASRSSRDGCRI